MKKRGFTFLFIFGIAVFFPFLRASSAVIYATPEEVLTLLFPRATLDKETKQLSPEQKESLKKKLGATLSKDEWSFTIARAGQKIIGYALVDHEIGKTDPITFMTAISPTGEVLEVEILVYRESYGSEIKNKSFRQQFKNKTVQDPLKLGKDISNITGATLSSRAVTRGVKRALALWNVFYGP